MFFSLHMLIFIHRHFCPCWYISDDAYPFRWGS